MRQSMRVPVSFATLVHFAIPALANAANASGVLPAGSLPATAGFCFTFGG
jgi:hypothetical protein